MGILNVTPDSFSDGGCFSTTQDALDHAKAMIEDGADIIDVGGESTRPGADSISVKEELARVIPVVKALREYTEVAISVDTSKAEVAERALAAGADVINDVTGFRDEKMIEVCSRNSCGLVLMHMQGDPQTMQIDPSYCEVNSEVRNYFQQRMVAIKAAGVERERVVLDPGVGFGKRLEDNLSLISKLEAVRVDDRPILLGLSRKSFIGMILKDEGFDNRDAATASLTAYTTLLGASVHRVHNVRANREALEMLCAISSASEEGAIAAR